MTTAGLRWPAGIAAPTHDALDRARPRGATSRRSTARLQGQAPRTCAGELPEPRPAEHWRRLLGPSATVTGSTAPTSSTRRGRWRSSTSRSSAPRRGRTSASSPTPGCSSRCSSATTSARTTSSATPDEPTGSGSRAGPYLGVGRPPGARAVPASPERISASSASTRMSGRPRPCSCWSRAGSSRRAAPRARRGRSPRPWSSTSTSIWSSSRLQRITMRSSWSRSAWASMALVVASDTAMRRSSMRSSRNSRLDRGGRGDHLAGQRRGTRPGPGSPAAPRPSAVDLVRAHRAAADGGLVDASRWIAKISSSPVISNTVRIRGSVHTSDQVAAVGADPLERPDQHPEPGRVDEVDALRSTTMRTGPSPTRLDQLLAQPGRGGHVELAR